MPPLPSTQYGVHALRKQTLGGDEFLGLRYLQHLSLPCTSILHAPPALLLYANPSPLLLSAALAMDSAISNPKDAVSFPAVARAGAGSFPALASHFLPALLESGQQDLPQPRTSFTSLTPACSRSHSVLRRDVKYGEAKGFFVEGAQPMASFSFSRLPESSPGRLHPEASSKNRGNDISGGEIWRLEIASERALAVDAHASSSSSNSFLLSALKVDEYEALLPPLPFNSVGCSVGLLVC